MTGECLFLDVDCIMHKDVRHVFDTEFDVAATIRYKQKWIGTLPFSAGVTFCRTPEFMRDVAGDNPFGHGNWMDTEAKYSAALMSGKYVVRALNGYVYNYAPDAPGEDLSEKAVVHYKGKRKSFLYKESGE